MRLDISDSVGRDSIEIKLTIDKLDLMNVPQAVLDSCLMKQCERSKFISEKLFGLELIVQAIEEYSQSGMSSGPGEEPPISSLSSTGEAAKLLSPPSLEGSCREN